MELPYYKWYNEVWPTLYNKDPENHILKGTISIVKRDSLKSKKSNLSNNMLNKSFQSANSIKNVLNRRISVRSGQNSQLKQQSSGLSNHKSGGGGAYDAPFKFTPFQHYLNNTRDEDNETMMERMEDEVMDAESYNSGSLGKKKLNQN